jgi:cold shock CspA family protein
MKGTVQKYDDLKGYGFVLQGFKTRLFFHVREWKSDTPPRIGMAVTFDVAAPNKLGQLNQAVNVMLEESGVGGAK